MLCKREWIVCVHHFSFAIMLSCCWLLYMQSHKHLCAHLFIKSDNINYICSMNTWDNIKNTEHMTHGYPAPQVYVGSTLVHRLHSNAIIFSIHASPGRIQITYGIPVDFFITQYMCFPMWMKIISSVENEFNASNLLEWGELKSVSQLY